MSDYRTKIQKQQIQLLKQNTNYSSKFMHCIKTVEETKQHLLANSNYDMSIDRMLLKIWEEINEKNSWS